jgi:putative ABC transport system permease protein
MLHDIRLALRTLRDQKGFALAALVTLALGIGANTAIFSVVYGVLLRPLPFPDPDRLVQLSEVVPGGTPALPGAIWVSNLSVHAWAPARQTIGPISIFNSGTATVGLDSPRRVARGVVSPYFFEVLGVHPVAGRFFRNDEADQGAAPVIVLSEELWRESFGGDVTAVGRTVMIDDRSHQIIGVAPAGLGLPTSDTRLWTPGAIAPTVAANGRDTRVEGARAFARLMPGASIEQAAQEGTALARTITRPLGAEMLFGKGGPVEIHVRTLSDQMTFRARPALLVLLVGVALLLLIACANVANLFLSRGVSRERDLAVRIALGAGRARLIRDMLLESLVISSLGGLLGVGLAWTLVRAIPTLAPESLPRMDAVALDWRALAFAVCASVGAGVLAGLVPALRGTRVDLLQALREGVGASSSRRTAIVRRGLLVAEASIAVMLLVAASLLGRSFVQLMETDAGYDTDRVLSARIYLPGASRGQAQTTDFLPELLARVRALPGVRVAGAGNMAPLGSSTYVAGFTLPVPGQPSVTARALSYVITPGYAEALGLRLRKGRFFDPTDEASAEQRLIVNEAFVKTFMQGVEPVGFRFDGSFGTTNYKMASIIGVVGNVLKDSLDQSSQPEMYVVAAKGAGIRREVYLVARTAGDPIAQTEALRRIVRELRSDAALDRVVPLADEVANSVAQPRLAASVLVSFAGLALLLAAVGLYGVLSYTVARRRREIGVRSALGATRLNLVTLVIREGMTVAIVGLVIGLAGAAALTRLMRAVLFGIEPLDPISFAVAPTALVLVALVACAIPARRAAKTDPAIALRQE